ncbi:hypothetical protein NL676_035121 [Syzygium grande]|nr:hypothetical protein NL676_035121 [Syzygium grande]
MGYLTGDTAVPAINDPTWAVWDAENSTIMTWLTNSMEEDIGANYLGYHTAKELWDAVYEMYSDLGNQSQIYELTLKLGKMRQGEETVTKYFHSLKRLWHELDLFNDHEWNCTDDGNRILGKQPLPPIGEVFSEVRREESRRGIMLGKATTSGKDESLDESLLTCEDQMGDLAFGVMFATNPVIHGRPVGGFMADQLHLAVIISHLSMCLLQLTRPTYPLPAKNN